MYIHVYAFVYIIYICIIVRVCSCPAINHTTKSVHAYYRNSRYRTIYAELKIIEFLELIIVKNLRDIRDMLNEHICIHIHTYAYTF